jgi:hypothetical protein
MSGETALTLESFAREFESTTTDVEIELVSKGDSRGTLQPTGRGEPPVLAQSFETPTKRIHETGSSARLESYSRCYTPTRRSI